MGIPKKSTNTPYISAMIKSCKYGNSCYRKNPQHVTQCHGGLTPNQRGARPGARPTTAPGNMPPATPQVILRPMPAPMVVNHPAQQRVGVPFGQPQFVQQANQMQAPQPMNIDPAVPTQQANIPTAMQLELTTNTARDTIMTPAPNTPAFQQQPVHRFSSSEIYTPAPSVAPTQQSIGIVEQSEVSEQPSEPTSTLSVNIDINDNFMTVSNGREMVLRVPLDANINRVNVSFNGDHTFRFPHMTQM